MKNKTCLLFFLLLPSLLPVYGDVNKTTDETSNSNQNNHIKTQISSILNTTEIISELNNIDSSLIKINDRIAEANYTNLVVIMVSIVIAGIASISAAASAFFSRKQLEQTQDEIRMRLRPWIGVSQRLEFVSSSQMKLSYKNYGQLPPINISVQLLIKDKKITRADLTTSGLIQTLDLGVLMPTMEQEFRIGVTSDQYKAAMSGRSFYVAVRILYTYSKNKNDEYGVIYHYNLTSSIFAVSEEWGQKDKDMTPSESSTSFGGEHIVISDSTEPKVISRLERVTITEPIILDEKGIKHEEIPVGKLVKIGATITSNQDIEQEFAFLVQILDQNGVNVYLSSIEGIFLPYQSFKPVLSWMPQSEGEYNAQIFVWEKISEPKPLTKPTVIKVKVTRME